MDAVRKPPVINRNAAQAAPRGGRRETDFEFDKPASKGTFPWLGVGLIFGAVGTGLYFGHESNSLLGQGATAIIGMAGLHGLWRGGFRKIVMLPVTIALMVLVSTRPDFAAPAIKLLNGGQPSTVGNVIACGLAVLLTMIVTTTVVRKVREKVILKRPILRGTDRLTGTSIGALEGGLVVLALCWSAALLGPQAREVAHHPDTVAGSPRHVLATTIVRLNEEIDGSPIRNLVRNHNVLAELPTVKAALNGSDQFGAMNGGLLDPANREKAAELLKQIQSGNYSEELNEALKKIQSQTGGSNH